MTLHNDQRFHERAICGNIEDMDLREFKGKRVTVMGLGINRGGLGVTRFLARAGARVLVTDMKSADALAPSLQELRTFKHITYVLGEHREQDFIDTDLVIQNPGVPRDSKFLAIARAHRIPIMTDIGLFLEFCPSKHIIAITGTKGKTTTTALIAAMCRAARKPTVVAGNIGISVLDTLADVTPNTTVILEISSWQLEGIAWNASPHPLYSPSPFHGEGEEKGERRQFAPSVAVLTNILPDHLDRYNGIEEYAQVKASIFAGQSTDAMAIINADDPRVRKIGKRVSARVYEVSTKRRLAQGCTIERRWIVFRTDDRATRIMPIKDIPLPGSHNLTNVLFAVSAALAYGITPLAIRTAVTNFRGVPHRLEFVREARGVRFINDSTATMPDATVAAIKSFDRPIVLICGGKDKQLDFAPLIRALRGSHVRRVILLEHPAYTASTTIRALAERAHIGKKIIPANSMREAVALATQHVKRGDIILLSPAAASFGMFANEFDRGDQFRSCVKQL